MYHAIVILCKINVNTLNQYVFLLIFMANTKATKRQSKTCVWYFQKDISHFRRLVTMHKLNFEFTSDTIGHLCIQLSLSGEDQKSRGNQAYLEIISLVT